VLLTCGTNQCASIEDAAALAGTAYARIKSLVLTPSGVTK